MKIRLENTNVDPRIYDVLIDFTEYSQDIKYFPMIGKSLRWQSPEVPVYMLDELLHYLKLRRITYWRPEHRLSKRANIYRTTVISDRMNKRNDVG